MHELWEVCVGGACMQGTMRLVKMDAMIYTVLILGRQHHVRTLSHCCIYIVDVVADK